MVLFLQERDTATEIILNLSCFRHEYLASFGLIIYTVQSAHVVCSKTSLQSHHVMQNMWVRSATPCISYIFSFELMFFLVHSQSIYYYQIFHDLHIQLVTCSGLISFFSCIYICVYSFMKLDSMNRLL